MICGWKGAVGNENSFATYKFRVLKPPLPSPRGRGEATAWVQGHKGKEHGCQAFAQGRVPLYQGCRLPPGGTEGGKEQRFETPVNSQVTHKFSRGAKMMLKDPRCRLAAAILASHGEITIQEIEVLPLVGDRLIAEIVANELINHWGAKRFQRKLKGEGISRWEDVLQL